MRGTYWKQDADGGYSAQELYKAFGESRYTDGTLGTDYKFTGQRMEASLGIYWFQSRWFDAELGRFTQPDSIVPTQTQGTQAWDRYAFVNNNPVRYNDPTGHGVDCGIGENCAGNQTNPNDLEKKGKDSDGGGDDENEDSCYHHISNNYWANVCKGDGQSNINRIIVASPGTTAMILNLYYDSQYWTIINFLLAYFPSLISHANFRLPWKTFTAQTLDFTASSAINGAQNRLKPWDDVLSGYISSASDKSNQVNITIITNLYTFIGNSNRGSGPPIFSQSSRFVVLIQPTGVSQYQPVYINNIFLTEVQNYFGGP